MTLARYFYLILILLSGWLIYYLNADKNSADIQVTPNLELPMFSGNGLTSTTYNPQGTRNYQITSNSLDYYSASGNTTFDAPMLKVYRDGSMVEWKITAKRGILTQNQVLTLYDNVLAENLLEGASFDQLSTAKLSIQLRNNDFWSDTEITLSGYQFQNVSQAIKGNFSSQIAELYNHVQGIYENFVP